MLLCLPTIFVLGYHLLNSASIGNSKSYGNAETTPETVQAPETSGNGTQASEASTSSESESGQSESSESEPDQSESQSLHGETSTNAPERSTITDSSPSRENDPVVKLAFVGDILLGSTVQTYLDQHGYDYPYEDVAEILGQADWAMGNLETPVTEGDTPEDKKFVYKSSPEAMPSLKQAGIDMVNLANNHVLDYGIPGLMDTFAHLDDTGIERVGAGRDITEAYEPKIVEKNGIRMAFLGFSRVIPEVEWKATRYQAGVADTYEYERPVQAIRQAEEEADIVVVFAHWGDDQEDRPNDHQKEMAHRYIDAGADLVVGSHPQVLQSIEYYKGKWIAYSLGNFIFTTNENPETWESVVLQANCTKSGQCELDLVALITKAGKPVQMDDEKGKLLLERLNQLSEPVIEADGKVTAESGEHPERRDSLSAVKTFICFAWDTFSCFLAPRRIDVFSGFFCDRTFGHQRLGSNHSTGWKASDRRRFRTRI